MPPLNVVAVMLLWMGAAIALVIGAWLLARWLMPRDQLDAHDNAADHQSGYRSTTRDLSAAVAFRIAALYSIILALVYAQLLQEFRDVRDGLNREAIAISKVYNHASRYGDVRAEPIRGAMRDYTRFVVEREWRTLGEEGRLSTRAWDARERALQTALDLPEDTPRRTWLRGQMLAALDEIASYRQQRFEYASSRFGWLFWIPAILGLVLVVVPFYVFAPTRQNRIVMACFGAFTGLILFFIQGFGSPFREPVLMSPAAFRHLLDSDFTSGGNPFPVIDAPSP